MANINFDERNQNEPIEFEGGANEVCEGCTVDLVQDGTCLSVRVQGSKGHAWTGEITGFRNTDDTEIGNLKVGSTIQFEDRHIFRCAA